MTDQDLRFKFGKNWNDFIEKHYSEERVEMSRKHILDFLGIESLEGKYFLDIGCGSGLHSLAALRAGASRIVSFDVDPEAVETTKKLREFAHNPDHWTVLPGSILDKRFLETIEPADIVYSWGVLHHTGEMWKAVENAAPLMRPDGKFYLALYQDVVYLGHPMPFWVEVKKQYNRGGWLTKKKLEGWYLWACVLGGKLKNIPGLIRYANSYQKSRGMRFYTDVVDWLGGYPFEVASVAQVNQFVSEKLGLRVTKSTDRDANAEYLIEH